MPVAPHRTLEAERVELDALTPVEWAALQRRGATDEVFQTRAWHRAWYAEVAAEEPLLVLVRRDGEPVALLPLVVTGGLAFLAGVASSDFLDVVGEASPATLTAALRLLGEEVPGLVGVRLNHVPDGSPTPDAAAQAAHELGWSFHEEAHEYAPALRIAGDDEGARAAADKKSLRRHERSLERDGELRVTIERDGAAILPQLDAFFDQHERRWAGTPYPSLFTDPRHRRFYTRLTEEAAGEGWLHFTRVDWDGEPVAFHYGFAYGGSLLWYKPAFAPEHARRSPGEVLLRRLILDAIALGAETLDFGMGDEAFKQRFATQMRRMRTFGLYR